VGVKIAVIGGGISGLCASHQLVAAGHDVICFEASGRPGGLMRTERLQGFLCEVGPNAILDGAPEVRTLIAEVGLSARVCAPAPAAQRRMIYTGGRLRTLPAGPGSLLSTDLLSAAGKWRLLREPFVKTRVSEEDESILDFATRRAGAEVAQRIAAPAVLGVFAGDAAALSMRSTFPRIVALEAEHGSVIKGMKAARKLGVTAGKSVSFPEGLEELPRALAARLGGRLVATKVTAVRRDPAGWIVDRERFDSVIVACSPRAAAEMLETVAPEASAGLRALTLASVAVVSLGFRRTDLGLDLDAYGFLVARGERPTMLGCQYESTVFPGRAPEGAVLLRAILGGSFEPRILDQSDARITDRAVADLNLVAGLNTRPDFTAVWRLPQVLPQYELGHERRVRAIEEAIARRLRLHLLTVGLRGIGLTDCIRNATALARSIGPA
jgi:oxygen-dependent protoporphyrinogen oxidase